ncbi:hypothetical protein KEM54_001091 [Ascosphaera aggregata]|nr:hypothetical protein KEM54_001091 [Ascosphaera aggregata]
MAWNPTNDEERPWMTNAVSEVRYPKQGTTNVTPNQGGTVEGTDTVWGIDSNGEVYVVALLEKL